ncbi:hypothetical protein L1049_018891 [Liquidambar formosana]|uniref:Uncharacterized protein n=1 Tax=Liquidambar formosana TaxID=63359 RepID=A0AAP0RAQ2_LIQFO
MNPVMIIWPCSCWRSLNCDHGLLSTRGEVGCGFWLELKLVLGFDGFGGLLKCLELNNRGIVCLVEEVDNGEKSDSIFICIAFRFFWSFVFLLVFHPNTHNG